MPETHPSRNTPPPFIDSTDVRIGFTDSPAMPLPGHALPDDRSSGKFNVLKK
jgi:hypothetical protein